MIKILLLLILIPNLLTAKQEYIGMSHKISDPFVKEFAKKNRMYPIGLGGGMMYDVDFVAMIFSGTQQLEIPEVRRLYVQGMEDLLARYNTNLQIRPYLHYFPISTDLFDFGFMFQSSSGGFVSEKYVASVNCCHGIMIYDYYDHKTRELKTLHEESYAEAVRIVQAERNHFAANTTQSKGRHGLRPEGSSLFDSPGRSVAQAWVGLPPYPSPAGATQFR